MPTSHASVLPPCHSQRLQRASPSPLNRLPPTDLDTAAPVKSSSMPIIKPIRSGRPTATSLASKRAGASKVSAASPAAASLPRTRSSVGLSAPAPDPASGPSAEHPLPDRRKRRPPPDSPASAAPSPSPSPSPHNSGQPGALAPSAGASHKKQRMGRKQILEQDIEDTTDHDDNAPLASQTHEHHPPHSPHSHSAASTSHAAANPLGLPTADHPSSASEQLFTLNSSSPTLPPTISRFADPPQPPTEPQLRNAPAAGSSVHERLKEILVQALQLWVTDGHQLVSQREAFTKMIESTSQLLQAEPDSDIFADEIEEKRTSLRNTQEKLTDFLVKLAEPVSQILVNLATSQLDNLQSQLDRLASTFRDQTFIVTGNQATFNRLAETFKKQTAVLTADHASLAQQATRLDDCDQKLQEIKDLYESRLQQMEKSHREQLDAQNQRVETLVRRIDASEKLYQQHEEQLSKKVALDFKALDSKLLQYVKIDGQKLKEIENNLNQKLSAESLHQALQNLEDQTSHKIRQALCELESKLNNKVEANDYQALKDIQAKRAQQAEAATRALKEHNGRLLDGLKNHVDKQLATTVKTDDPVLKALETRLSQEISAAQPAFKALEAQISSKLEAFEKQTTLFQKMSEKLDQASRMLEAQRAKKSEAEDSLPENQAADKQAAKERGPDFQRLTNSHDNHVSRLSATQELVGQLPQVVGNPGEFITVEQLAKAKIEWTDQIEKKTRSYVDDLFNRWASREAGRAQVPSGNVHSPPESRIGSFIPNLFSRGNGVSRVVTPTPSLKPSNAIDPLDSSAKPFPRDSKHTHSAANNSEALSASRPLDNSSKASGHSRPPTMPLPTPGEPENYQHGLSNAQLQSLYTYLCQRLMQSHWLNELVASRIQDFGSTKLTAQVTEVVDRLLASCVKNQDSGYVQLHNAVQILRIKLDAERAIVTPKLEWLSSRINNFEALQYAPARELVEFKQTVGGKLEILNDELKRLQARPGEMLSLKAVESHLLDCMDRYVAPDIEAKYTHELALEEGEDGPEPDELQLMRRWMTHIRQLKVSLAHEDMVELRRQIEVLSDRVVPFQKVVTDFIASESWGDQLLPDN